MRYAVDLPPEGVGADTGLILFIHGFGSDYNDSYGNNLGPFLAKTYNCLVARVDYFGSCCHCGGRWVPTADFFVKLHQRFGLPASVLTAGSIDNMVVAALESLHQRGIREVPEDALFLQTMEYNSFGILPALDHLQVLHDLLRSFPIDRRRLFVLGTSYGGYIALLLNKLAPRTFRLIVDNSGFSSSEDSPASVYGFGSTQFHGVRIITKNVHGFSPSRDNAHFFAPAFAQIRELRDASHYFPSSTAIHCFHSRKDTVALAERKRQLVETLQPVRHCRLTLVDEPDLDGRTFKTLDHGMQASMRGVFDLAYQDWLSRQYPTENTTDFELDSTITLPCADKLYVAQFHAERGVRLSIAPRASARSEPEAAP